jgi:hypothetical protein
LLLETDILLMNKFSSETNLTVKNGDTMIKKMTLMLLLILFALSACQAPPEVEEPAPLEGEPFALYLVGDSQITGPDIKNYPLDKLPLNVMPILTTADIVSYDWDRHGINLTEDAYFRLLAIFMGGLPSSGIPFAVKAYEQPVYAGAFWTLASSLSFDGVVILQPSDPAGQTLYISLGYPGESNFTGEDPRANPRLKQALEDAGVLVE